LRIFEYFWFVLDWLEISRGGDITELVHSSHLFYSSKITPLLKKYHVRSCLIDESDEDDEKEDNEKEENNHERYSHFTFESDGFYVTLRFLPFIFFIDLLIYIFEFLYNIRERCADHIKSIMKKKKKKQSSVSNMRMMEYLISPSLTMSLYFDVFLIISLSLLSIGCVISSSSPPSSLSNDDNQDSSSSSLYEMILSQPSYLYLILGGLIFGLNCIQAHNWFHKGILKFWWGL